MGRFIFHISNRSDWEHARSSGRYEPPSFAADGFIHFSDLDQVATVANVAFSGTRDLVLMCVAVDRLAAPVKYERSDDSAQTFPHLYGPLNLDAVVRVVPLVEGTEGFTVPSEAASLAESRLSGRS